jgi:prepilin-type N-terminal cleavage/methylation domain-containing protein/prepilin-type processing-associated H-X9-DG protein
MNSRAHTRGFSLLEVAICLVVVAVLLAVLVPTLSTARLASQKDQCRGNLRVIGAAWAELLGETGEFPTNLDEPGWRWGGARFALDGRPYLDADRPVNRFLDTSRIAGPGAEVFHCPADDGITGPDGPSGSDFVGTGSRTAFRAFGTSYRANTRLLDARLAGVDDAQRGLKLSEVTMGHSEVVLLGNPVWFEVLADTGRSADWFGQKGAGNMLMLDGSVRFMVVDRDSRRITSMFHPIANANAPAPTFP